MKRNRHIAIRLSEEEFEYLDILVRSSGLCKEEYTRRRLIYNKIPIANPYKDLTINFGELLYQIRSIRINIDQIAAQAEKHKLKDTRKYRRDSERLSMLLFDLERIPLWVEDRAKDKVI